MEELILYFPKRILVTSISLCTIGFYAYCRKWIAVYKEWLFLRVFFWLLLVILDRQHKRNFLKNFFLKEEMVIDGS